MMNRMNGEQPVMIGGREYMLRFTWDVLARIKAEFGDGYEQRIFTAVNEHDLDQIAVIVSLASNGAITVEDVRASSPPIIQTVEAIMSALKYAFNGEEGPSAKKKATLTGLIATWLSALLRPRS